MLVEEVLELDGRLQAFPPVEAVAAALASRLHQLLFLQQEDEAVPPLKSWEAQPPFG